MINWNGDLTPQLEQAARMVRESSYLVVLVGAGLSVESGIPSFRGPGGLWTRYGQPSMLSYQQFIQDPGQWWEQRLKDESTEGSAVFELKSAVDQALPNPGHYALVELERRGLLKGLITQNVDDLHHRAGSKAVMEIHGNRTWLRCIDCGSRRPREGFEIGDLPPRCPQCTGIIKLDTVMFGEPIPPKMLQACWELARICDCMLLIGTSGAVNPAAQLPLVAKENGASLIEINTEETALTPHCDLTLTGPSGELLPLLVELLQL
jgi:NAD-dependent deacetylase